MGSRPTICSDLNFHMPSSGKATENHSSERACKRPSARRTVKRPSTLIFHIAATLVVTIWGGSFVWTRELIHEGLNPVEIYIYRFLVAYLLIWPFSYRKIWANSVKDEVLLMLCGLCGGSIYFMAENTAVAHTTPSNVSLLTSLAPLLTVFLIGLIYKNDRPSKWVWIGSVGALAGVALIVFKNGFNLSVAPLGDMLAISAAFSWALYSLVLRKVDANYSALFITRKTFFYGLITALPFMLAEPSNSPVSTLLKPAVLTDLLVLSIGASLMGYFLWSLSVKKLGAITASNYLYVQPIATMVISAIQFEDDPITLIGTLGCLLIIGGVWFGDAMTRRDKQR